MARGEQTDEETEEVGKEIESGEEEAEVCAAAERSEEEGTVEIKDHKGRKLKVKVKKIDPAVAVDDHGAYT